MSVPATLPPEAIIQGLCMGLADHCGRPWAGMAFAPRAAALLDHPSQARWPVTLSADNMTIVARAPVPATDGETWGEILLGDLADTLPDHASEALIGAVAEALGRLLDRAAARQTPVQQA